MTKSRWYAKENNEKSLVYHWSLKLIEAFRRPQAAQTLWEFVRFWIYKLNLQKKMYENKQNTS